MKLKDCKGFKFVNIVKIMRGEIRMIEKFCKCNIYKMESMYDSKIISF